MELRSSRASNYSGPTDPEALRDELARRLLSQYTQDTANADEITAAILRSFGIEAHGIKQTHVATEPRYANKGVNDASSFTEAAWS